MSILDCAGAWKAIEGYQAKRLTELFESDGDRVKQYSRDVASIHFDWSKTHLDEELLGTFAVLAYAVDYYGARDFLFAGDIVNSTENRPATHVAERGEGNPNDNHLASERHQRMPDPEPEWAELGAPNMRIEDYVRYMLETGDRPSKLPRRVAPK